MHLKWGHRREKQTLSGDRAGAARSIALALPRDQALSRFFLLLD